MKTKKKTYTVILLMVCLWSGIVASKECLHYDFTSMDNAGNLLDLSGNGHNGVLSGDFRKVRQGKLEGLAFNGTNTVISVQNSSLLKQNGPFTLLIRFRITPEQAARMKPQSPLLFGSVDNLSVNRNFSLFFDRGRMLELDVGNGQIFSSVTILHLADGKPHTVAFVIDAPFVLAFVDGECTTRHNDFTLLPSREVGVSSMNVGNWHAGFFEGEMYDLQVYDQALSSMEAQRLSGNPKLSPWIGEMNLRHSDKRSCLEYSLWMDYLPKDTSQLELLVDGKRVIQRQLSPEERMKERILEEGNPLDTTKLSTGEHRLEVVLRDLSGKILGKIERTFKKSAIDNPKLFKNTIGITDEVLPPWTPIQFRRDKNSATVAVWNREYTFFDRPLAGTMKSNGVLSPGEASLELVSDGQTVPLKPQALSIFKAAPNQVVLEQSASSDKLEVKALHIIDYDGFDRIRIDLTARQNTSVEQLVFRFPMDNASIRSVVQRLGSVEPLGKSAAYGFKPTLFLAGEKQGVSYLSDSNEYWFPKNNQRAIRITRRTDKELLLEIQPIAETVALKPGQTFTYEIGMVATPIRPMTDTGWQRRYGRITPYCSEMTCTTTQREGVSVLDYYANLGMKGFICWRTGKAFGYPPIPGTEFGNGLTELVKKAHARGMKAFPYCVSFLFSEFAPEANEASLFVAKPERDFSRAGDFLEVETGHKQHTWSTCNASLYQNLILYRLKEAILATDMDGVYLDSTADSFCCSSQLHSCGYRNADGSRTPTYNGFASREFLRRIYTLVYQLKGTEGVVDVHSSCTFNAAAAAWSTSLWCGEQLPANKYAFQALPPDSFRSAYMGRNLGVEVELLHYTMGCGYKAACALALVHDIVVRPSGDGEMEQEKELWRIRRELGCDDATFIGYWEPECPVKATPQGIYASCFRRKDGALVAIVSNLTPQKQTITLEAKEPGVEPPAPFELESQDFKYLPLAQTHRP